MADVRLRDLNPAVLDYDLTVAGSVGIGTTSPGKLLELSNAESVIRMSSSSGKQYDIASGGGVGTTANDFAIINQSDGGTAFRIKGGSSSDGALVINAGKVGIGTAAPDYTLDVAGNIGIDEYIYHNGDTNTYMRFQTDSWLVRTAGSDRVYVATDGKVGIGTTSPAYQVDIENSSNAVLRLHAGTNASASVRLKNDAQDWDVNCQVTDKFAIYNQTAGVQAFTIDTSNNVGIGTTSPTDLLTLGDGTGTCNITINKSDAGTAALEFEVAGTDKCYLRCNASEDLILGTADSDRVAILADGKVGIGTTSPTEVLHVAGNLKVTGSVEVGVASLALGTGFIAAYSVAAPPSGWLACNGSAVSRTTYSDLYALIGTTYGAGDGSTTFNVPDLRGRTLIGTDGLAAGSFTANLGTLDNIGGIGGAQNHTLTTAELPSHTHSQIGQSGCGHDNCNGGWSASIYEHRASSSSRNTINNINSTGGGGSHNTVQPSLAISYLIKT